MKVLTLLEHLATHAHYRVTLNELVNNQPVEIKQAFLLNDGMRLKRQLGPTNNSRPR